MSLQQRMVVRTARLGPTGYRVLQPDRPAGHACLTETEYAADLAVDSPAAAQLAVAWALAARSPRSLIHLPLRANQPGSLDLVLLRHSLGFPVSRWKEVRTRLDRGRPQVVTIPRTDYAEPTAADHRRRRHRDFRDHLLIRVAAGTVFVIGSAPAFRYEAARVRDMIDQAPIALARWPAMDHYCAEIGYLQPYRPGWRRPRAFLHLCHRTDWD